MFVQMQIATKVDEFITLHHRMSSNASLEKCAQVQMAWIGAIIVDLQSLRVSKALDTAV